LAKNKYDKLNILLSLRICSYYNRIYRRTTYTSVLNRETATNFTKFIYVKIKINNKIN